MIQARRKQELTVTSLRCGLGFALLEVLVALVVTSIGLLGLAALQTNGLRDNHGAYLRTQASYIAYDIADRMRSNLDATVAGAYRISAPPSAPTFDCITNFTGTAVANACNPTEMAQADLYQWYAGLPTPLNDGVQGMLPAGQATIVCADSNTTDGDPCTRGSLHAITVRWDGDRNGTIGTGATCDPAVADDLSCVQMAFQP